MEFEEYLKRKKFVASPDAEYYKNSEKWADSEFEWWLGLQPEENQDEIRERLKYLWKYLLRCPVFDGEEWSPSQAYMRYYETREERMQYTGISQGKWDALMDVSEFYEIIEELGISEEATFDFIVYLWSVLKVWVEQGVSITIGDMVEELVDRIKECPDAPVELDVKIGKKHFKFSDDRFIKALFVNYVASSLSTDGILHTVRANKRLADYILIKTLLEHLPINVQRRKEGAYTQSERDFCLYVLWLVNEFYPNFPIDDARGLCGSTNNGVFDKLMKDYRHITLPILEIY